MGSRSLACGNDTRKPFDAVWIDCLNGDKYKTGKLTPDGHPDPSIFSTEFNREGIQVGTGIALLLRNAGKGTNHIQFRQFWGKAKRNDILATLSDETFNPYHTLAPPLELGLPFTDASVAAHYLKWPLLTDLLPVSFPGVQSKRDEIVVDIDKDTLTNRMRSYFDPSVSDLQMRGICPKALESTQQFDAPATRAALVRRGLKPEFFVKYCYRPFDFRWIYWEPEHGLLGRRSPDYFVNLAENNSCIEARQKQPMADFDRGYATSVLADNFGNGFSNFSRSSSMRWAIC